MSSGLLGPKGKQIPDHSLEMLDLPFASAPDMLIISNETNVFAEKTGDDFLVSKMSEGAEVNRVWSAAHSTAVVGDIEAALDAILGV
jgi:hypothetical protein